jgi:hypothetical protein
MVLRVMGRTAEAVGDARRSLALVREIGDPPGEVQALAELSFEAHYAGDHDEAARLARQAGRITAGIPGRFTRGCSSVLTIVLAGAGDRAEAARAGAAGLARARGAGDLWNQAILLPKTHQSPGMENVAGMPNYRSASARTSFEPRHGVTRQAGTSL